MYTRLEWQIIGTALTSRFLCRREGSRGGILLRGEGSCHGSTGHRGSGCWGNSRLLDSLTAHDVESTNLIEPTPIVLMGINVERNRQLLIRLDIKLLDTVFTKNTEDALARICTRNLNHIFLRHPRIACALRHATVCRKYGNDSTC